MSWLLQGFQLRLFHLPSLRPSSVLYIAPFFFSFLFLCLVEDSFTSVSTLSVGASLPHSAHIDFGILVSRQNVLYYNNWFSKKKEKINKHYPILFTYYASCYSYWAIVCWTVTINGLSFAMSQTGVRCMTSINSFKLLSAWSLTDCNCAWWAL